MPYFFATIGAAMGASASTAVGVGITTTAAVAASATSIAASAGAFSKKPGSLLTSPTPSIPDVPAPKITDEQDRSEVVKEEKKKLRQGRAARTTLKTGPQGLLEAAPVGKKTLLGE